MPSRETEPETAEMRFRQAFARLKAGRPTVLARGTQVSQNNVALEAGCVPSALRKTRFPALVREVQAFIEIHKDARPSARSQAKERKFARRSMEQLKDDAIRERDEAQSIIASANSRIIELTEQVQSLQRELDELRPPPARIR